METIIVWLVAITIVLAISLINNKAFRITSTKLFEVMSRTNMNNLDLHRESHNATLGLFEIMNDIDERLTKIESKKK